MSAARLRSSQSPEYPEVESEYQDRGVPVAAFGEAALKTRQQRTQQLAERAQRLAELRDSRAWAEIRAVADEKVQHEFNSLAKALLRGDPVVETAVVYKRGFFAGMKFLLDSPEFSGARLERALRLSQDNTEGVMDSAV